MSSVKAQDLLVLLKLVAAGDAVEFRQVDLSQALGLSQAEIHNAIKRATQAGLFMPASRLVGSAVRRQALAEFLIHGVKYVFPARVRELTRGLPTAWGLPSVAQGFVVGDGDTPVWPWSEGTVRGGAVEPLYKTVPQAAAADPVLHELLALTDSIRVGRVRDREIAAQRLQKKLVT